MGVHGRPVDEAEALVWCEAIRLRALTLADQVNYHISGACPGCEDDTWCDDCKARQGWMSECADLLREVANG
jgi:hypothetical protein